MSLKYYIYIVAAVILLVWWEFSAEHSNIVRLFISSPMLSINYFVNNYQVLNEATYVTLYESIIGLMVATFFSFFMMILCFYLPKFEDLILPLFIVSQIIPIVTLAPLFIVIFGMGILSKIAMASLMCFFPIFINFAAGVNSIPKNINELLFLYDSSTTFKIKRVYFPLALPQIFAGLKISATLAVIGAIVAEFNGAELGLGKNLYLAAKKLDSELMICSIFLTTALGGGIYTLIVLIEKYLGKWYIKKNN